MPQFQDNLDLPNNYGVTRMVLITRDPYWIYAYWEVAPGSVEAARAQLGRDYDRSAHILRLYEVEGAEFTGHNAVRTMDIAVGPQSRSWYINVWADNRPYCADLGVRTPEGRFFSFARSNCVATPRWESSDRHDSQWMEVRDDGGTAVFPAVPPPAAAAAVPPPPPAGMPPAPRPPMEEQKIADKKSITEADVRAYYRRLFLQRRRKARLRKKGTDALSQDLLRAYRKIRTGASEEMQLGASETLAGGASERPPQKRQFFFEIGTELIVYGRTEPDAMVKLGEKAVTLRPDGTFTLRFALPDGAIPLDFKATSADQAEKRSISTSVERKPTRHDP